MKAGDSEEAKAAFRVALEFQVRKRFHTFLSGIKAYHRNPVKREVEEKPIVWSCGTTKLRDYSSGGGLEGTGLGGGAGERRFLMIPSLVNRFDILDLDKGMSFLRFLGASGISPFVVDWDDPGEEEKTFSIADYVSKRLLPIIDKLTEDGRELVIGGYCMGGLLALASARLRPEKVRALALIATPWDFGADPFMDREALAKLTLAIEPWLEDFGLLPVDVLQAIFSGIQPIQILEKFVKFAARDPMSREARRFVLAEDWLNQGVPLGHCVTREVLKEWYEENRIGRNLWELEGVKIDPRAIRMPSYVVIAEKDKIVAPQSAGPLADLLPNATVVRRSFGHIGLMTSLAAREEIWKPLAAWIKKT